MMPSAIGYVEARPIIELALWSLLPLVLGTVLRRGLPFLAGFLRLVGNLGLILALILAAAQFFSIRTGLSPLLDPTPQQTVAGSETRIRMNEDGHFWVNARANGTDRQLLVDTGATLTTLSAEAADDMGAIADPAGSRITLTTANGQTEAELGIIPSLRIGNIVVRNLPVAVAPGMTETNVLGMNFLSQLAGWRVEGRTLILVPHHPQAPAAADNST